jgi:hypothetical protein
MPLAPPPRSQFTPPDQDPPAPPPSTPLVTPAYPWTDAEMADVRQFSQAWRAEHGITQGDAGDLEVAYENLRMQGLSHDDARQGAINVLGWQTPAAAAEAPPVAPPSAPSAPSGPSVPSGPSAPPSTPPPAGGTDYGGFNIPPPSWSTPERDLGTGVMVPGYVPDTPVFNPPPYTPPPEFAYDDYVAGPEFAYDDYAPTTAADLYADPSYEFRVGEGLQALTNSAAARGVANTGGTLKDFINYGQNAASQEFGAVDARRLAGYTTNRANAFGAWSANDAGRRATYTTNRTNAVDRYNTNYQTQFVDPYKIAYTAAVDAFTPKMTAYQTQAQAGQHESDQSHSYDYNTWLQQYNMWRAGVNDDFDRQYKITAL